MDNYSLPFVKGFLLMASVIFAVGPQNALLLKHSLKGDRPYFIAIIYTLCDFLLISLGVLGVGQFFSQLEWLRFLIFIIGSLFLFWFSFRAFRAAYVGGESFKNINVCGQQTKGTLLATALALSLLNPGSIIDTVVIVGSVSAQYSIIGAISLGLGAQLFSTMFFFALAAMGKRVSRYFNQPMSWRIIDFCVGLITLFIGIHMILFYFDSQ